MECFAYGEQFHFSKQVARLENKSLKLLPVRPGSLIKGWESQIQVRLQPNVQKKSLKLLILTINELVVINKLLGIQVSTIKCTPLVAIDLP